MGTRHLLHLVVAVSDSPRTGFDKVLYVRVDQKLLNGVETIRRRRTKKRGAFLSTSDVVRSVLWEAVKHGR